MVDNWIVDTDQSSRIHQEFCVRLFIVILPCIFRCCAYVIGHAIYIEIHIEGAVAQHITCNMMALNYDDICMTQYRLHTHCGDPLMICTVSV